jgi:DNA-binding winged helix-turn-helix (wHTH) protein
VLYLFEDFELHDEDFCLSRAGQRIPLEPKSLRVLLLLVSRAGHLVDKQCLLDTVWAGTIVEENTLVRTVAILRRELEDDRRKPRLIETVPTRGYRFVAPVEGATGFYQFRIASRRKRWEGPFGSKAVRRCCFRSEGRGRRRNDKQPVSRITEAK